MRLIDADKLQERMKKGMESGSNLNMTYDLYIEQAPTIEINDSISRSGAIEGVKELFACADIGNDECDIIYMLENFPSTDRLIGKWIRISNDWIDGTCGARYFPIRCSVCGYSTYDDDATKFCPNCGAKMGGGDSE